MRCSLKRCLSLAAALLAGLLLLLPGWAPRPQDPVAVSTGGGRGAAPLCVPFSKRARSAGGDPELGPRRAAPAAAARQEPAQPAGAMELVRPQEHLLPLPGRPPAASHP